MSKTTSATIARSADYRKLCFSLFLFRNFCSSTYTQPEKKRYALAAVSDEMRWAMDSVFGKGLAF
jgi:hypothetical protein